MLWNVSPYLVDPKWRRLWAKAELAVSIESTTNRHFDFARKVLGVPQNVITPRIEPFLGRCIDAGGANTHALRFAGARPAIGAKYTFAAMAVHDLNSPDQLLGTSSTTNAGVTIDTTGSGNDLSVTKGGVAVIASGLLVAPGTPFFFVVSHDEASGVMNFLVRNLETGSVQTSVKNNTSSNLNTDGIYSIMNARTVVYTTGSWNGACSMAFISREFFEMDFLRQWAMDPKGPFKLSDSLTNPIYWAAPPAGPGASLLLMQQSFRQAA